MKKLVIALALATATTLAACAPQVESVSAVQAEQREPVTILVSIDGFHPDYLDRGITPTLSALADGGVRAAMRPSFPTKTFPNHWTLVTGLVPDKHGITANRMEDQGKPEEPFTMATVDPYWWNQAKPVWVEAEEAGIRSAAMFWPGSAVPWGGTAVRYGPVTDGILPSDWQQFSMQVSNTQRVNSVLDWLRRPADIRPEFLTLYFDTVDSAGHDGGPESEEVNEALRDVDAHIAMLVEGLEEFGQPANLVIVSDHGMAATSSERVIALDEVVDSSLYRLIEAGAYATFEPAEGKSREFREAILAKHDHMTCWAKQDIPARYEYGTHDRIPPYFCLPETGWTISRSRSSGSWTGGNHGYDPFAPEMQAIFIASGPAFRSGATTPVFQNTAVAPLLRHLIGLPGASRTTLDSNLLDALSTSD
ncbi:ectonucleotide pyrophosphatase/phosphodiesterase [Qipengyuania sp. 1NDH17]|uniref:Ectonucleotide pyrophosphatase/phosphodiesterase n=1 Tax=Qipengyuania polymorpha TaxID=2867234 RepID=A0ABS7IZS0_9SPHN|nr:ectonucleotide pyrophosphatase/phosphodiesterase [Qipengyuania polymorpha]MBX7457299.1 ectonucleotide pyrophosphatase/phosphodiesterase [Qipengyuania polymorpha]